MGMKKGVIAAIVPSSQELEEYRFFIKGRSYVCRLPFASQSFYWRRESIREIAVSHVAKIKMSYLYGRKAEFFRKLSGNSPLNSRLIRAFID